MVVDARFALDEVYHSGTHTASAQDTAELSAIVRSALASGGVDAYEVGMTTAGTSGTPFDDADPETVHWEVYVTVDEAQLQTLIGYQPSGSFRFFMSTAATGSHTESLYSSDGTVEVLATRAEMAPSPPPPPGGRR